MKVSLSDWAPGSFKETLGASRERKLGDEASGFSRFQVVGLPHAGFGFEPVRIQNFAREVARRRAALGESQRAAVAQTPLVGGPHRSMGWASADPGSGGVAAPFGVVQRSAGRIPEMPLQAGPGANRHQGLRRPARLERETSLMDGVGALSQGSSANETGSMSGASVLPHLGKPAMDQGHDWRQGAGPASELDASELLGAKPSTWAVALAVAVDASLSFALLAACHLAVSLTTLSQTVAASLQNWAVHEADTLGSWSFETSQVWQSLAALPRASLEPWIQGGLVFVCWMAWLALIQFFSVSAFRATVGRALVGITVNPVVSTSRGLFSLPVAEVLTFGGLLSLPVSLFRTDRAVFVRSVRFKG